jgi:hypothetical protein
MPTIEVWGELMDVGTRLRLLVAFEEESPHENSSIKIRKLSDIKLLENPVRMPANGKYTVEFPFFGGKEEWDVRFEGGKMSGR